MPQPHEVQLGVMASIIEAEAGQAVEDLWCGAPRRLGALVLLPAFVPERDLCDSGGANHGKRAVLRSRYEPRCPVQPGVRC